MKRRLFALALGLTLLCSCASRTPAPTAASTPEPTPAPTATPAAQTSTPEPADFFRTRVSMLKGPTGLGCARLMEESGADGSPDHPYAFTVYADPTQAVAALTKGEVDIAALPTNLASTLYHKLDGGIQLLALNTYGVLYILENGDTVHSIADLRGRTIHAYGQGANPEFVLNYLLEQNGLDPDSDVDVRWHATSDEVSALMAEGEGDVCMLPVPAATGLLIKSKEVRSALDLTREWDNAGGDGALTMGCLVVRTDFARENPQAVETFLEQYENSIAYMTDPDNLSDAAVLAEKQGIVPKAAVAERAIPDANLCFVTGDDMMADIQGYYQVLFQADPASIGGSIPDGAFYYGLNK